MTATGCPRPPPPRRPRPGRLKRTVAPAPPTLVHPARRQTLQGNLDGVLGQVGAVQPSGQADEARPVPPDRQLELPAGHFRDPLRTRLTVP
jgi:hypothetical protein